MPRRSDNVRCSRKTGSGRHPANPTRLTHFRRGHSRTSAHNCAISASNLPEPRVHLEQRACRAAPGSYSGGGCRGLQPFDGCRRGRHFAPLKSFKKTLVDPKIVEHRGRIVKTTRAAVAIRISDVRGHRRSTEIHRQGDGKTCTLACQFLHSWNYEALVLRLYALQLRHAAMSIGRRVWSGRA